MILCFFCLFNVYLKCVSDTGVHCSQRQLVTLKQMNELKADEDNIHNTHVSEKNEDQTVIVTAIELIFQLNNIFVNDQQSVGAEGEK